MMIPVLIKAKPAKCPKKSAHKNACQTGKFEQPLTPVHNHIRYRQQDRYQQTGGSGMKQPHKR